MKSKIENPISGYPYVVLLLDKAKFKVEVASHCTNKAQATATVDELTEDPAKVEYMIVRDVQLRQQLDLQRKLMAKTMDKALGV